MKKIVESKTRLVPHRSLKCFGASINVFVTCFHKFRIYEVKIVDSIWNSWKHVTNKLQDAKCLCLANIYQKILPVVKIFTSKMSISWSWSNFKNSILNCQNGNIKCSSSQIKDQNVTFGIFLLIKTISYGVKKGVNLMYNQPLH